MRYLSSSKSIKDINKDSIIFAIDEDHGFTVTLHTGVDQSDSWSSYDLSPAGQSLKVHAFGVSQNSSGEIYLVLAGGQDLSTTSQVLIASALSNNPTDPTWQNLKSNWVPLHINPMPTRITEIILDAPEDESETPLIVIGTTERIGNGKVSKYLRVKSEVAVNNVEVFPNLANPDQLFDIKAARLSRGRGVYALYRRGNDTVLEFDGIPDDQYNVPVGSATLTTPPGALELQPQMNEAGFTDLYVKGNGKFLFTYDNQTAYSEATKISDDVDSANLRITTRSSLAEDYKITDSGKLEPYPVYRSIITFPPDVVHVDVWASEETTIAVQGETYTIDPVKPVRLKPSALSKLMVCIPATDLGCPTLRLHTNTMRPQQLFFVCPDFELHKKIAELDEDAIHNNRELLGVNPNSTKEDCANFQKTLQSITKAIQYTYNKTPHGYHHDRSVLPKNMDDAHFMLDFSNGNAQYQPLTKEEVEGHIAGARQLNGQAAQSFWNDLDDTFKNATHLIVHTAEAVVDTAVVIGDTTGRTVTHVAEMAGRIATDEVKTFYHVGEDLVRGDYLKARQDLIQGGENVARDLFRGVANVVGDLVTGGSQLLVITLSVAGEAVQFVLNHTGAVGKLLKPLLDKLGIAAGKALRWLLDHIGWEDVLHTHDVILDSFNKGLDTFISISKEWTKNTDKYFTDLEKEISADIDAIVQKLTPRDFVLDSPDPHPAFSKAIEKIEWLVSTIVENLSSSSLTLDLVFPGSIPLKFIEDNSPTMIENFFGKLKEILGDNGDEVIHSFDESLTIIEKFFSHSEYTLELLFCACLELVKGLAISVLTIINKILDTLIDLIELCIKSLKEIINQRIDIPFISDFYSQITEGRNLNILSLTSLLISLPLTILYREIENEFPFKDPHLLVASLKDLDEDKSIHKTKKAWGYTYGICHVLQGLIALPIDAIKLLGSDKITAALSSRGMQIPYGVRVIPNPPILGLLLPVLDQSVGFIAQLGANPIGYPDFTINSPSSSAQKDPIAAPTYWAHIIWNYQWGIWVAGVFVNVLPGYLKARPVPIASFAAYMFEESNFQAALQYAWGVAHMSLMSVLDVADRKKMQYLNQLSKLGYPSVDESQKDVYINYLEWAKARNNGLAVGNGISDKGFGNIMDTFPAIGKLGAMPAALELTEGLSYIGTAVFSALGNGGEAGMYIRRTRYNGLL